MRSYFVFSCVSSVFKNSLKSSSHLFLGLPTSLRVSDAVVKSGMPVENSSGPPFFQVVKQFFLPFATSVFCVFQSSMVSCVFAFVLSASLVLLSMYSIQCSSSSSSSVAPISSVSILLEGHIAVLIFV